MYRITLLLKKQKRQSSLLRIQGLNSFFTYQISDNLVVYSTIEEKHQFRDDSDSFSSHYDCITRNICNSIVKLFLLLNMS